MRESNAESMAGLHPEERMEQIDREFENRLILFCSTCDEMTRHTNDLVWYCAECGENDMTDERVKELVNRDL